MLCPTCGYVLDPFENTCPRCVRDERSLFEQVVQVEEDFQPEDDSYNLPAFDESQVVILPPTPEVEPPSITPVFSLNTLELPDDVAPPLEQLEKSCQEIIQPNEVENEETLLDLTAFDESQALVPEETTAAEETDASTGRSSTKHEQVFALQDLENSPSQLATAFDQVIQTDEPLPGEDIVDLSNVEIESGLEIENGKI